MSDARGGADSSAPTRLWTGADKDGERMTLSHRERQAFERTIHSRDDFHVVSRRLTGSHSQARRRLVRAVLVGP